MRSTLAELWPFFGLRVRTPRLEVRYPSDRDIAALADLAEAGIYEPGETRWMTEWADLPEAERARSVVQFQWRCRAGVTPDNWWLPFVAVVDGTVVGAQDVKATQFPTLRQVTSGSWLGLSHRSQGIGTEMRAAVLHLVFEGLGADRAITSARQENVRSIGVSERNGYRPNGVRVGMLSGERIVNVEMVLDRAEWETKRRHDIEIVGLEPCLPLLGISEAAGGAPRGS